MYADPETRVLLAAATARDGEITFSLLKAEGLGCVVCENLDTLRAEIDRGVGALLLTDEAFLAKGFEELLTKLKDQPSWSDIPVVILMRGERTAPLAVRVLLSLRNVTLLERPAPTRSVASAVQAAVRGRLRQYQIRDQIQTIRQSEERLRLAFMAPDMWGWDWNLLTDEVVLTGNAEQIWGKTRGTALDFFKNMHPDDVPAYEAIFQAAKAGGSAYTVEYRLRNRNGQERWVVARGRVFLDENARPARSVGVATDVTEQRRAREDREQLLASERAARADAEQAGRLKDEFLATLSHELRTPLTAILGWVQILRRHNDINPELNEGLAVIERNSRVQAQLIEDLLDMSRIISGKIRLEVQDVDIADITNAAIESVRPAADAKEIHLQKIVDTRIAPARGDPGRLQQVVWNLLSNAIKFTPKGGKVDVALGRLDNHVEISVTDSGAGIKPEFLPYVFERFRQADASTTRRHGGLGLGLAIVKNLVELHGGKVRAYSKGEGHGARFVVELPIVYLPFSDRNGESSSRQRDARRLPADWICDSDSLAGVTVLVVDDEEDARNLIARVLRECKATVVSASSGAQAIDLLMRERPSVVVSDIGMPKEDGYDFIRKVRMLPEQHGGKTPAAALTAFARSEDRTRALRAGFQTHVAKPIEPAELVAVVASLAGLTSPKNGRH